MNLLSPLSLLWLLPIGGIIVLLYLLKLKRKEQMVSSVMLWQDAVADIQANAPFQKLKTNLLLFLQLLILLLLVLAIARPFIKVRGMSDNKIVVILDSSASMQSKDVSPSRFEDAKSKAIDIVDKMGPGDTMLVMTAGSKARVTASFTSDKRTLVAAIKSLRPSDTACNVRQAMVLALSLVAGKSQARPRVALLSDGGFEQIADLSAGNAKLDFIRVGSRCDNVAITGMASRKTLSGEPQVFVGLQNFSDHERSFNVEIYLGDKLIDAREEKLAAGESKSEILDQVRTLGGRITAKLDINDDLAVDNQASVYLSRPRNVSVLLVSKGNIFLQNVLNLDPRTQLTRAESVPQNLAERKYDLVVLDGVSAPKDLPPGGYLLVNTSAPDGPADEGEVLARPTVIDWSRKHPVSAFVDFSDMRMSAAHELSPKPWGATIIESTSGALAVAGMNNGRRFVQLGWSLLDSDFPLRVGFPIFMANCLDYLAPTSSGSTGESVRTGQSMFIDVPPSTPEATVTEPDGRKQTIRVTQTPVVFDGTDETGVYKVSGQGISKEFSCNLASAQESNTAVRDTFKIGGKQFASTGQAVRTNQEFYIPILLIALAVLSFEWYAFHRRL